MDADPQPAQARRARAFCFTFNNPDGVPTLATFGRHARYLVYGHEVGENGTPHLQGFVYFRQQVAFSSVLGMLPEAHFEIARGSPDQNIAYCTKDGIWEEEGERPSQGKRSDLLEVAQAVRNGVAVKEIAESYASAYIRYSRGILALKRVLSAPRDWQMSIILIVGPTRTGKSLSASRLGGIHLENGVEVPNGVYWKPPGEWWDDYDGEHTVIWDEFSGASCAFRTLLRILDSYPLLVPIKGGFAQFRSRRVVLTSNIDPSEWYNYAELGHPDWESNPLNARLRENGRIYRTGDPHRHVRARLEMEVADADAEHQRWLSFFANYQPERRGAE